MIRTLKEIKNQIGERLHDQSSVRLEKIEKLTNNVYETIYNSYLWLDSIIFDEAVTTTASDPYLILPKEIQSILCISDRVNDNVLLPRTQWDFQKNNLAEITNTGIGYEYTRAGSIGIYKQPTSAGLLKVVSTSASDTTQIIQIMGKNTAGRRVSEEIELNGTSSQTGSQIFASVESWSKSDDTAGVVTILDQTNVELDSLNQGERGNRFLKIRLYNVPDGTNTLYVTGKKNFVPLVNEYDVPVIPAHDVIFHKVLAECYRDAGKYDQGNAEENIGNMAMNAFLNSEIVDIDQPIYITPDVYKNGDDVRI